MKWKNVFACQTRFSPFTDIPIFIDVFLEMHPKYVMFWSFKSDHIFVRCQVKISMERVENVSVRAFLPVRCLVSIILVTNNFEDILLTSLYKQ